MRRDVGYVFQQSQRGSVFRRGSYTQVRGFPGLGGPLGGGPGGRGMLYTLIGAGVVVLVLGLTFVPLVMSGGLTSLPVFGGQSCTQQPAQLAASRQATGSIPANFLAIYQKTGAQTGIPWEVLAGIGEVETDHGRANLPGVRSGQNGFGAAGPMQIGIGGAAGDQWGGAPIHPASANVGGVGTDGNGDGVDNVYDPADAVPAAAKYLLGHGAPGDMPGAIFAYNHLESYVQDVLSWASRYTVGGFTVSAVNLDNGASCLDSLAGAIPNGAVQTAISFAQQQLGKPYLWGGTGPGAFDCSGLTMMAYRAAGITIPRTSQAQWAWGPRIAPGHEIPGDLVFFVGSDGTPTSPGHVGMVLGHGKMLEAEQTGVPIHIVSYTDRSPIGFTRPWAHSGVVLTSG